MTENQMHCLKVGEIETNCYLLQHHQSALIIDPGDETTTIINYLTTHELKPLAILLTHGHFDHIMAAGELQKKYQLPAYLHQADQKLIAQAEKSYSFFLKNERKITQPDITHSLIKTKHLKIDNWPIEVIHTPGHTAGSVCYYFPQEKILFSGDTLFANGSIGRTDFAESLPQQMSGSLTKLWQLPSEIIVYPGHGLVTSIKQERLIHQ